MPQFGVSANPTYLADGPDYFNYSWYGGQAPSFPGAGWGMPSSPAFSVMQPRDLMARGNQYAGNEAFAPMGGLNFGSPLANMFGSMVLGGLFGKDMRPLTQPNLPALDYFRAQQRFQTSQAMTNQVLSQDSAIYGRLPEMMQNKGMQMLFDMFNPGGSQQQAFQAIYGRFGSALGGNMQSQANESLRMLGELNRGFVVGSGPRAGMWDYNQSFGLDRVETSEALDAAGRYGIGGLSMNSIVDASRNGGLNSMARKNNEIFATARDIFGKDKGFDELANLMNQSIEGLSGLDQTKAADLLNKIQATSRAVNVSSKAFAEYAAMFNQLARERSLGGAAGFEAFAGAMQSAKSSTEVGRASGDMIGSDF